MINSISMGQFIPVDSPVHKMDPGAKLISSTLIAVSVLISSSMLSVFIISAWILIVLVLARIRLVLYWRIYKPIWILLIISFSLQLIFTRDGPFFKISFLTFSISGLISGGWMLWQLAGMLLVAALLTFSTTPLQLSAALERLLLPFTKIKVPVREFAMAVNLALRFIPTLFDEARLLISAQRSRGADFTKGGLKERSRSLIPLMVPLLSNIFKRADELAVAMEIRCYTVGAERSSMTESKIRAHDYAAISISSIILLASFCI